jgi:lipoprotein-anchoring transpeptidase ErfK/SrfK
VSRKSVAIFLTGFLTSTLIFGVVFLLASKPANEAPQAMLNPAAVTAVFQPVSASAQPAAQATAAKAPTVPAGSLPPSMNAGPSVTSQETPAFKAFVSKTADTHSLFYEVKKGDSLYAIAKQYHVIPAFLERINGVDVTKLRVGSKIKIPAYRLSLVISKSKNILTLKGDEDILKTYTVSTGENNSTPVGVFKVTDRLVDPTWYKAGAVIKPGTGENQLGSRWIGISAKGYGIHGTTEPDKLGRQITAGCVRLKNEDVEELYDMIPPGTQVTIVD